MLLIYPATLYGRKKTYFHTPLQIAPSYQWDFLPTFLSRCLDFVCSKLVKNLCILCAYAFCLCLFLFCISPAISRRCCLLGVICHFCFFQFSASSSIYNLEHCKECSQKDIPNKSECSVLYFFVHSPLEGLC